MNLVVNVMFAAAVAACVLGVFDLLALWRRRPPVVKHPDGRWRAARRHGRGRP